MTAPEPASMAEEARAVREAPNDRYAEFANGRVTVADLIEEMREREAPKRSTSVRSARIYDDLWARVLAYTAEQGTTATSFVNDALADYLQQLTP